MIYGTWRSFLKTQAELYSYTTVILVSTSNLLAPTLPDFCIQLTYASTLIRILLLEKTVAHRMTEGMV